MTGATGLPDDPERSPLETEDGGEEPGNLPAEDDSRSTVEPVDPNEPEPDVDDAETATPI